MSMDMDALNSIMGVINPIAFWLLAALLILQAYILIFHRGVPNLRTAGPVRKKNIQVLAQACAGHEGPSYTVVDLGSGNGLLARDIAQALPQAHVVGIEIAPLAIRISNHDKMRLGIGNLDFICSDFFLYDLSGANAVIIYQLPMLITRIVDKILTDCRSGTLVLCNRFALNDARIPFVESHTVRVFGVMPQTVYVYRVP